MEYSKCCNCDYDNIENFCSKCGQKRYRRIDRKYIFEELQYTFLHMNKGFLYTAKSIIKNPGKTAIDFINGNRVNHYKPILFTFLLAGFSTFISFKLLNTDKMINQMYDPKTQKMEIEAMNNFMSFASKYNSIIMMMLIPVFALFAKIVFNSKKHNYYEHVIMSTFGQSAYLLLTILVIFPIMFLFKDNFSVIITISSLTYLFIPILMFWFYKNVYPDMETGPIILRILGIIGFGIILYIISVIIMGAYMVIKNGPEYFMPK